MTDVDQGRAAVAAALWDDNPADFDLLGFDAVVAPVLAALRQPGLDPITIGIHAPWGGGKSSVLSLIAAAADKDWVVVRTNPWEYEDHLDVKSTLIAEVLGAIKAEAPGIDKVADRFVGLLRRVSWSRVGMAIAKGAVTMRWSPAELLEAFTPSADNPQQSMVDFRREFADTLELLPIKRVVVLVDDLDRCLPPATVATLEAIKLFLSVKKMAFVIAADQDMVRDAIAASLAGTNRSEAFASHYLEKIVQLPISLPRLSPADAEAYIALLLTAVTNDREAIRPLVAHCADQRRKGAALLEDFADELKVKPSEEILRFASQVNDGLLPSQRGNPREIKRFLNAFGVRSEVAAARGVEIAPAVMVKMLLLEDRHPTAFETLAGLSDGERAPFLKKWEAWGRGETEDRPDGVTDGTRLLAGSAPALATEDLTRYITLAATLAAATLGGSMSDELRGLVRQLVMPSQAVRDEASAGLGRLSTEERRKVAAGLLDESRRGDEQKTAWIIAGLAAVAKIDAEFAPEIASWVRQRLWTAIDPAAGVELAAAGVAEFRTLAEELSADESVRAETRVATQGALEG